MLARSFDLASKPPPRCSQHHGIYCCAMCFSKNPDKPLQEDCPVFRGPSPRNSRLCFRADLGAGSTVRVEYSVLSFQDNTNTHGVLAARVAPPGVVGPFLRLRAPCGSQTTIARFVSASERWMLAICVPYPALHPVVGTYIIRSKTNLLITSVRLNSTSSPSSPSELVTCREANNRRGSIPLPPVGPGIEVRRSQETNSSMSSIWW